MWRQVKVLLYGYYSCRNTKPSSSSHKARWVCGLRAAVCSLCPLLHSVEHRHPLTCCLAGRKKRTEQGAQPRYKTMGKLSFVLEMPPLVGDALLSVSAVALSGGTVRDGAVSVHVSVSITVWAALLQDWLQEASWGKKGRRKASFCLVCRDKTNPWRAVAWHSPIPARGQRLAKNCESIFHSFAPMVQMHHTPSAPPGRGRRAQGGAVSPWWLCKQ